MEEEKQRIQKEDKTKEKEPEYGSGKLGKPDEEGEFKESKNR